MIWEINSLSIWLKDCHIGLSLECSSFSNLTMEAHRGTFTHDKTNYEDKIFIKAMSTKKTKKYMEMTTYESE